MPERVESFTRIPKYQVAGVPENRTDVEVIFEGLPKPIDMGVDVYNRVLYWTDRGDSPRGNTVNRAAIEGKTEEPVSGDSAHPLDGGNWDISISKGNECL